MDDPTKEERPNLCKLLEERLSELGLDPDTYGPYVVGSDAEELPDVIELLKASSENEDGDDVWQTFTKDILNSLKMDEQFQQEKDEEKIQAAHQLKQERSQKNKAAIESSAAQKKTAVKSSQVDDPTKKALMQRFGYEMPDEEDAGPVATNKQVAASANIEKTQELRNTKTQTKKEEQQKTKEQRTSKAQLKEERRKKAQKGERKA
jgi:hypothetical protein